METMSSTLRAGRSRDGALAKMWAFDFDDPTNPTTHRFGSSDPLPLEIGGAKGDSGGGVFINLDGRWQLCGIVSGGLNRQVKYGSVAALARVSSANAWIDSVTRVPPAR